MTATQRSGESVASSGSFIHRAVGTSLVSFTVDQKTGRLEQGPSVELPAAVQYGCSDRCGRVLYVAVSDGAPGLGIPGRVHLLNAFLIDPRSGALTPHGAPRVLPWRPIHLSVDPAAEHLLVTFNTPPALRVYRLEPDGTLGPARDQSETVELGNFPHHARVSADGSRAVVACRGHNATPGGPEQPGSLHVFRYHRGALTDPQIVAPGGGYGFGPRDIAFHPSRPWLYTSLERQNELWMFAFGPDGRLESEPRFRVPTLRGGSPRSPAGQIAGPVHLHPNGRVAYVINRAPEVRGPGDRPKSAAGDNTIAVCQLGEDDGRPHPLQYVDTEGMHCRTFAIDSEGTILVTAHITSPPAPQPPLAGLSVFRIDQDGRLELCHRRPEDVGERLLFWMGMTEPTAPGSVDVMED